MSQRKKKGNNETTTDRRGLDSGRAGTNRRQRITGGGAPLVPSESSLRIHPSASLRDGSRPSLRLIHDANRWYEMSWWNR